MYRIVIARHFEKQCAFLKKRYPRVFSDIQKALRSFRKESAQSLGAKLYKLRVRSSDIRKGKSGGFRAIVLVIEIERVLIPIVAYAKSDTETISEKELEYHLSMIVLELRESGFLIR